MAGESSISSTIKSLKTTISWSFFIFFFSACYNLAQLLQNLLITMKYLLNILFVSLFLLVTLITRYNPISVSKVSLIYA